jgi:hypothetical protein
MNHQPPEEDASRAQEFPKECLVCHSAKCPTFSQYKQDDLPRHTSFGKQLWVYYDIPKTQVCEQPVADWNYCEECVLGSSFTFCESCADVSSVKFYAFQELEDWLMLSVYKGKNQGMIAIKLHTGEIVPTRGYAKHPETMCRDCIYKMITAVDCFPTVQKKWTDILWTSEGPNFCGLNCFRIQRLANYDHSAKLLYSRLGLLKWKDDNVITREAKRPKAQ